jgi:hypothetical protein
MNPEIETRLARIDDAVERLRSALRAGLERERHAAADREQAVRERWGLQKRVHALERASEDYERAAAENERLTALRDDLETRLFAVLSAVKALSGSIRA